MKNTSLFRRILSVVLVVAMVLSVMVPMASAESAKKVTSQSKELDLTPIDPGTLESQKQGVPADASNENQAHKANDVVRVSIVLEKASTLEAGYKAESYTKNAAARAYRESLRQDQKAMTVKIEEVVGKLEVKWNLTLAANIISANVRFGDIEAIKAIDGVKDVFLENRYEPQVDEKADEPNNGSASYMIGSNITWANGYTGAGSKVAVIDTGADTLHQSFSGEGLEYALAQTAEEKGMSYDEYVASLNLLTADKIEALKGELNANIGSGAAAYRNTKIGFGYNYVDKNVSYIDHDQDTQGEHGSHVSGIATGNRFIKVGEGYQPALSAVGTQGVAPDAQLVVMKVFGKGGGAYDSDYMVAIEDAIVLGCDSANLSLGSGSPGFSFSSGYESVMNKLVENGTVVAFSAGNSGMWYDTPNNPVMQYPYLHIDDVNYQTNGSPGSFTNSLSTASVDNMGQTGMPLIFGDRHVFYSQTSGYGNDPISTIAGQEYEYVLVDGPGVDDNDHVGGEGDQFAALGSEVLSGKVAMCYRGSSSFFAKANAAVAQGAVAVVIINNQAGVINMNLTGYNYTAPAVSILKADGDAIKADSEAVTDEAGNVLYYKGSMSVAAEIEVQVPEVTDTVSVSSFSSYGVPGTMVLKPEILTPGGSIYSVNGYNQLPSSQGGGYSGGHDQYEVMSGTSMASPQTAGMAAVMGQYIRDNGLCEKTGLSQRQLINSLLMSTAHPVFDEYGDYWPTFRVGAGLGNIADATAAKSYILMDENATLFPDTAKDGKVKVELGDDPDYTGEYSYSFTVYPLEGAKEFTLRTDIFTQGVAGNGGYGMLQDTGTMLIGSVATYEVNGETYEDVYELEADVNMDGETNEADAQAILDHLTGEEAEDAKFDAEAADVDGDNAITTLDAKLILDSAATPTITITEPTKVTVNIKIDEEWKALLLNYYFTKGFFVEGYTYVEPVADEEGALDVVHSIPIFGFCGSWTGPAMLDRSSAIDEAYGTGKATYITNAKNSQYLSIKDPDGAASIYMGNPYMIEDEFPVERLAMNSEATITAFNYLNIRNAATLGFAVQDEEGNVLYAQATPTQKFSAYYYVNGAVWQNTSPANYNVGKKLSQAGVKEGDVVTVGFYALPEYYGVLYAKNNGEVAESGGLDTEGFKAILESGVVGDGAAIKYTVKIDDQAPEVKGALLDLITGDITIRAQDDNYIAYMAVTNKSGSKVYMEGVPEQEGPGELVELPLELPEGEALPNEAVLLVGDYAGNEVAFKVNLGGSGSDEQESIMLGFVGEGTTAAPGSGNRAWEIEPDALWYNHSTGAYAGLSNYANLPFTVTAAEYVDGYVFMAADDGWLYAAPLDALDEPVRVGEYVYLTEKIYDLAFNYKNNTLYALGTDNSIYYVDLLYGVQYKVAEVTLPGVTGEMNRLAIDDDGVFYTANYGSGSSTKLFKFTLEGGTPIEPEDPEDPEEPIEGETAYAWGFETGLDGWTAIDADGDGYNWTWNQNIASWYNNTPDLSSMAHTGTGAVLSGSYINTVGALTPDNWLVSPAFDLSEADAAVATFWLNSIDPSYPEQVTVYAGTSADPAGMVAISDAITTPSEYTQYSASLADFVGEEEVHLAVRNNGTNDMFLVVLDDVEIILPDEGEAAPAAVKAVPAVVRGEAVTKPHEVRDAGDPIVSFSFENEDELNAWTFDGDETNWIWSNNNLGGYDYSPYAYDGSAFLMSYSFVDNVGAYQADNWAISPAITLAEEGEPYVTFAATNANASYPENFSFYVGTSPDPDDMELIEANISPSTGAGSGWTNYSYDLSDYLGQTIYLGFYDYNYDAYEIWIDLVQVYGDGGADQPDPEPEPDPEPVVVQAITAEVVGSGLGVYNYSNAGSMAWDHDNDILYLVSNWNTTQDYDHYLWVVDTETGVAARANETQGTALSSSNPSARLYGAVRGLVIVPGKSHLIQPTDVVEGLEVEPAELNIFKGQTAPIAATAFPWTLTEKGVTFESADPSIATVNAEGIVTGVEVGSTTVTVTTVALDLEGEPLSLDVDVNVSVPPEAHLRGIIWDENGKGQASEFDSNAPEEWTALAVVGQLRWGALVGDTVYGSTEDTMYAFDADTYEVTQLGGIVSMWIPSDACELPQDFREAFAAMGYNVGPVIGPNNNGTYLTMLDPEAGSLIYFDLSDNVFGSDPLATFTYAGRDEYDDGESVDTNGALFYGATESGELYAFVMNHEGSIMWTDMGNIGIDLTGVADATNSVWASMVYDAETSFLFLSLYNGTDDYAHLYAIDTNDLSRVGETGNFNADVWPVTGLYEYEPATDLVLKVSPDKLNLFEGETAELNIKVKLGETNEYTVEVADESVCTFEDGIVTAVKEGETTITVTTVDVNEAGEHLSVEVPVKVKGFKSVEGFVTAQVTDEHGTRFTKISLDGAVVSKKGVEAPGNVQSGGRGGNIYVADINGSVNVFDAETFEPTLEWNEIDASMYPSYPAMDFANYPTYLTPTGVEVNDKVLMTLEVGWLVMPSYSGWNLSSFIPDLAAVAFAGLDEAEDGTLIYTYFLLGANGDLYYMGVDFAQGRRTEPQLVASTGITLATQNDASMTMLVTSKANGDGSMEYDQMGLVIADNGSKKLYYLDFLAEEEDDFVGLIGIMDVDNVSGLAGSYDELDSIADIQGIEPFDPGPEPEDPGEYPEPAEGFYEPLVEWGFEPGNNADGWTFFDRDADGNNWLWTPESDFSTLSAHDGVGMIISQSYINGEGGGALTPDNFAISPAIDLSEVENANFSFYAKGQDPSYASEVFAVYAGTTNVPGEMIKISPDFTATGSWALYEASLADFAGEPEVYVAIRHYNVTDMYILDVDDAAVMVEGGEAPPEPVPPVYGWYFESANEVADWTLTDADGDGRTFAVNLSTGKAYEGSGVLESKYNANGNVDDIAITPALDFSELTNATLSFWAEKNSTSFQEHYAVYIGTSANLEEMEELLPETVAQSAWVNHVLDLADYCGEDEVYIAFRHFNTQDQYNFYIDAVEITTVEEEEPTEPTEPGFEPQPSPYYVVGDMNNWEAAEEYRLVTTETEGKFVIKNVLIDTDEELKILDAETNTWYPGGSNNNCHVYDANTYDIEFYPAGGMGDDYFYGYFKLTPVNANGNNAYKQPGAGILNTYKAVEFNANKLGDGYGRLDVAKVEASAEIAKVGETVNAVSGSTNAIRGELIREPIRLPVDETVVENGNVQIVLTEDKAVTNGLIEITYDANVLTFEGAVSELPYKSIHHEIVEETVEPTEPTEPTEPVTEPEVLADGFYLIGPDWNIDSIDANEKFETNPANESEYQLATTLAEGDKVKVVKVESGAITDWYPDGLANEYNVDAEHAGNVTIYFQETYKEDWSVFGGYFWIQPEGKGRAPEETEEPARKGVITIAYASADEIPAEEVLATLNFSYEGALIDTEVKVKTLERNDDLDVEEDDLIIPIKVEECEHVYGEPEWTWAEDFSSATAKFVCSKCGDEQILDAEITAECLEDKTVYTAKVTFNETEYTDVKEGPAAEVYELVDVLKDGEKIVIVNSAYNKALSNEVAANYYLAGKDVAPVDEKILNPAEDIVWTVEVGENGVSFVDANGNKVALVIEGRYTNLKTEGEDNVWILEAVEGADRTYFVKNATAKYNDKDQYLEWYDAKNYFSGYGMQADKADMYTFQFYAKAEGEEEHDCKIAHFTDVMEAYPFGTPEHEAIEWAFTADPQVTAGTSEATFGVGKAVKRGDAMFYLWVAAGKPEPTLTTSPFTDVTDPKAYYYKAVLWAYENGITKGVSDTEFGRKKSVSRRDMMVFLYTQQGKPTFTLSESPYTDVTDPKAYYYKAVLWAYEKGIDKGADGMFNGKSDCLRETVVLWMYRTLQGKALAE